jgi:hypothetical protein
MASPPVGCMSVLRSFALGATLALAFVTAFSGIASAHDEVNSPGNCAYTSVGYCYWCPSTYSSPGHVHCTERTYCYRLVVTSVLCS